MRLPNEVRLIDTQGRPASFDHVVIAAHGLNGAIAADQLVNDEHLLAADVDRLRHLEICEQQRTESKDYRH